MNRMTRTMIVVISLVAAALTAAPAASALTGDDDGTKFCKRTLGVNACVAVDYADCTLWVSALTGGCLTVADET